MLSAAPVVRMGGAALSDDGRGQWALRGKHRALFGRESA